MSENKKLLVQVNWEMLGIRRMFEIHTYVDRRKKIIQLAKLMEMMNNEMMNKNAALQHVVNVENLQLR